MSLHFFVSLALGAAAASNDVAYLRNTFETTLLEIFLYFHNSAIRKQRYKELVQRVETYAVQSL